MIGETASFLKAKGTEPKERKRLRKNKGVSGTERDQESERDEYSSQIGNGK